MRDSARKRGLVSSTIAIEALCSSCELLLAARSPPGKMHRPRALAARIVQEAAQFLDAEPVDICDLAHRRSLSVPVCGAGNAQKRHDRNKHAEPAGCRQISKPNPCEGADADPASSSSESATMIWASAASDETGVIMPRTVLRQDVRIGAKSAAIWVFVNAEISMP